MRDGFSSQFLDELKSLIQRESERTGGALSHRMTNKTATHELIKANTTVSDVASVASSDAKASGQMTTVATTTTTTNIGNALISTVINTNSDARQMPPLQSKLFEDKPKPAAVKFQAEKKSNEESKEVFAFILNLFSWKQLLTTEVLSSDVWHYETGKYSLNIQTSTI